MMSGSAIQHPIAAGVEIHRGYEPGLIGRVGELHGRYYAATRGVGAGFEAMNDSGILRFRGAL
jgi:hypothetical protein